MLLHLLHISVEQIFSAELLILVEALLDELDSAVAPTPAPVVEKRSVVGRSGVLGDVQPSKTGKCRIADDYTVRILLFLTALSFSLKSIPYHDL